MIAQTYTTVNAMAELVLFFARREIQGSMQCNAQIKSSFTQMTFLDLGFIETRAVKAASLK